MVNRLSQSIQFNGETFEVSYEKTHGVEIEGYDIEGQLMADALTDTIGLGQLFSTLKAISGNEEEFKEAMKEWEEISRAESNKCFYVYLIKSPIKLAALAILRPGLEGDIAANIHASQVTCQAFVSHKSARVRRRLATNRRATPWILSILIKDRNVSVRREATKNPNINASILEQKVGGSIVERLSVALNKATGSELLNILCHDEVDKIRAAAAKNPNTHVDNLSELLKDNSYSVYRSALLNKNTKEVDILDFLKTREIPNDFSQTEAQKFSSEVQMLYIDQIKKIPFLKNTSYPFLRNIALTSKENKIHEALLEMKGFGVQSSLSYNKSLSDEIIYELLNSKDDSVLKGLTWNHQISHDIQEKLLKAIDSAKYLESLGASLAGNPNLSLDIFVELTHKGTHVRKELCRQDNLSIERVSFLVKYEDARDFLMSWYQSNANINLLIALNAPAVNSKLKTYPFLNATQRKRLEKNMNAHAQEAAL